MAHHTCPVPPAVGGRPNLLEAVADQLLAAQSADDGGALVRVRAVRDGVELGLQPLPAGVHPADVLVGQVLPRRWSASGLIVGATAHHLDTGVSHRVTVVALVDRSGRCVHRLDGCEVDSLGQAPTGRMVDLLLRSVGRPTPPTELDPGRWWDTVWVDRIVDLVAEDPHRVSSSAQLHGAHPLHGSGNVGRTLDWSRLRALAAGDDPAADTEETRRAQHALAPFVDRSTAAWMDDGCFARWLTAALPPIEELLGLTDTLLTPALAQDLRAVVCVPRA